MEEISSQNSDLGPRRFGQIKSKRSGGKYKESHFVWYQKIREMVRQTKAES